MVDYSHLFGSSSRLLGKFAILRNSTDCLSIRRNYVLCVFGNHFGHGMYFCDVVGRKITDKGIGNGISLLIMVGIIATLPQSFLLNSASRLEGNGGFMLILIELVIWFLIILASVLLVMAVRKIQVQYARRTASGGYEKNVFGSRQFLPLKLNASGVMPIIFAQAIMFVPALVGGSSWLKETTAGTWMQANFSDIIWILVQRCVWSIDYSIHILLYGDYSANQQNGGRPQA